MMEQLSDPQAEHDRDRPETTTTRPTPARHGARKQGRLRLSCLRCQRRKIRCDGAVPSCGACSRASVACVDGDQQRQRDLPRAYISSLKNRIRWLESKLQSNCPDLDITHGPQLQNESNDNNDIYVDSEENQTSSVQQDTDDVIREDPSNINYRNSSSNQPEPQPNLNNDEYQRPQGLAHEIGLVSLSNGNDPKYIGPSSGYFFAKLMVASLGQQGNNEAAHTISTDFGSTSSGLDISNHLLQNSATRLPSSKEHALRLSATYFDIVHTQYPFLHRPTHENLIDYMYTTESPEPIAAFQVNMVLAISSIILSCRLKIHFPGEGYCSNAMHFFDQIGIESSIQGLQCLLLLLIYTLHSPSMKLNAWYLNYQCIAAVIDLGLQRDVRPGRNISTLQVEMRTRIFWVVFSLDRTLATMMGRPIGIRDEACDQNLPADIDDKSLLEVDVHPRTPSSEPTHMTFAIHLFRLAKLNSEMKYVLHSINREPVPYAYPAMFDLDGWQNAMLQRLHDWAASIPSSSTSEPQTSYISIICQVKYHSIVQLLLRPTPAIPSPTTSALKTCYESATNCIRLFNSLYKDDLLVYSTTTFHTIILSTVTMFYCIWNVSEIAAEAKLDVVMADLRAASKILSASGEHWRGAKRSGDLLDELGGVIVRRIIESKTAWSGQNPPPPPAPQPHPPAGRTRSADIEAQRQYITPENVHDQALSFGQESGSPNLASLQANTFPMQAPRNPAMEFSGSSFDAFPSLFERHIPDNTIDVFMQNIFQESCPMSLDDELRNFGIGLDFI